MNSLKCDPYYNLPVLSCNLSLSAVFTFFWMRFLEDCADVMVFPGLSRFRGDWGFTDELTMDALDELEEAEVIAIDGPREKGTIVRVLPSDVYAADSPERRPPPTRVLESVTTRYYTVGEVPDVIGVDAVPIEDRRCPRRTGARVMESVEPWLDASESMLAHIHWGLRAHLDAVGSLRLALVAEDEDDWTYWTPEQFAGYWWARVMQFREQAVSLRCSRTGSHWSPTSRVCRNWCRTAASGAGSGWYLVMTRFR